MFNTVAIGLTITATDRATRIVNQVGRAFDQAKEKGKQLKKGLEQLGKGLQTFSMAAAAVAAGLGFMASRAANFEQQMSAVRSVMVGVTEGEFSALTNEIKRLGATTSKSATEAAQGAEMLARAGFTASQTVSALSGVIAAAEADSIDLQTATNVVANSVRAFGLEAERATQVADVLALTSARTNTNITQLGEGMRYAAPIANQLGQSVQHTSMALGLLANMGLQGSVGGTALKNMMLKLSTASDSTKAKLRQLGISTTDVNGNMRDMPSIIEDIAGALPRLGGNMEQTAFLSDTFGLRGMAAAGNLATAFGQMQTQVTTATGESVTQFEALRREIENVDGAAQRMAAERLNNLKGAFTLLGSAIEGVSIEAFSGPLAVITPMIKRAAEAISRVAEGMQNMSDVVNGTYNPAMDSSNSLNAEATSSWIEIGAGMKQAFNEMSAVIAKVGQVRDAIAGAFGGGNSTANQTMGKMVAWGTVLFAVIGTLVGAALVIIVPLMVAGKAIVAGLALIASALMYPLAILGVFLVYVQMTRKEGQSFFDRMTEIFGGMITLWSNFATGFMAVYDAHIGPSIQAFKGAVMDLFNAFQPIFLEINAMFAGSGEAAGGFGVVVGHVVNGIVTTLGVLIQILAHVVGFVVDNFVAPILNGLRDVFGGFQDLLTGVGGFPAAIGRIFSGLFRILFSTVLYPFKAVFMGILSAMNYVGALSDATYNRIRTALNGTTPPAGAAPARQNERLQNQAFAQTARAGQAQINSRVEGNQAPNVNVEQPETRVSGCIDNQLNVNGRRMAAATAESQFELATRAGANLNPWQQGAIAAGGMPAGTR